MASAIVLPWTLTFMIGKANSFWIMLHIASQPVHRHIEFSTTCAGLHLPDDRMSHSIKTGHQRACEERVLWIARCEC